MHIFSFLLIHFNSFYFMTMFICEALESQWVCLVYEKWYINKVALLCLAYLSTFELNLINRIYAINKMLFCCLQFTKKMTVTMSSADAGINSSFIHTVNFLRALGVPENNSIQVRNISVKTTAFRWEKFLWKQQHSGEKHFSENNSIQGRTYEVRFLP